jgi:hypothetical protein
MIYLQPFRNFSPQPSNIKIELVDEAGNHLDPKEIQSLEYLSKFQNPCVVNKICRDMVAENRTGTVEVYQDKIVVRDN